MSNKPVLQLGSSGEAVEELQRILIQQGFGFGQLVVSGLFDEITEDAVSYFQMTHINEHGEPLKVDGWAGENTWWALYHHSGEDQRNHFDSYVPKGIGESRTALLNAALSEHQLGVHEEPDGSNWGDGVVKYGGEPGWAWCCLFASWVAKQAFFGRYPLGAKFASCYQAWKQAEKLGLAKLEKPVPGDQFIMLYTNLAGQLTGTGHTGYVLAVSEDGQWINTVEGNAGNRVKIGKRPISQIYGFIDLCGDAESVGLWEVGLVGSVSTAGDTTR